MDEFRLHAYECVALYNDQMKFQYDKPIKLRSFSIGNKVLLYNSKLRLFPGKLKSRWSGPFKISQVFPHGEIELKAEGRHKFKVNGLRVKQYLGVPGESL